LSPAGAPGAGTGARSGSGAKSSPARPRSSADPQPRGIATPPAPDRDVRAGRTVSRDRPRVRSTREDDKDAAPARERKRPLAGGADPPLAHDAPSLAEAIANPFRDAPAWVRPFMLGMLAVALLLIPLGALPPWVIPWPGAAAFVARRRPALLGVGAGLLGGLAVAVLALQ
jgi:hypothetical protein